MAKASGREGASKLPPLRKTTSYQEARVFPVFSELKAFMEGRNIAHTAFLDSFRGGWVIELGSRWVKASPVSKTPALPGEA